MKSSEYLRKAANEHLWDGYYYRRSRDASANENKFCCFAIKAVDKIRGNKQPAIDFLRNILNLKM